jgi:hypothetical protein
MIRGHQLSQSNGTTAVILAEMEKAQAGRPSKNSSRDTRDLGRATDGSTVRPPVLDLDTTPKLTDLGVTKTPVVAVAEARRNTWRDFWGPYFFGPNSRPHLLA